MKLYYLTIIAAAFLLQGAQAAATNSYNDPYGQINFGTALKMFYTSFQKIMPCGYPQLNIPVLAPFSLEYYAFNQTTGNYSIKGSVSSFSITGLNNFHIISSSFNTTTNRTSYDIIYPEMQILGDFEVDGEANLAGYMAPFRGKGLLNTKIIDYRLVGDFVLSPIVNSWNGQNGVQMSDFNLQFYVGNVINSNWNKEWDIAFNNFVNKVAAESFLTWAQEIQIRINDIFDHDYLSGINYNLSQLSMTDIIDFLVYQSQQFDAVNCSSA